MFYDEAAHTDIYTLARHDARPICVDEKLGTKLEPIEGLPPDLIDLPNSCSFAPRCRYAIEKCTTEAPPLVDVTDGHLSACWRAEELADIGIKVG